MRSNSPVVVGIDPGARGGIAVLSLEGEVLEMHVMPTIEKRFDVHAFSDLISVLHGQYVIRSVGLEKVGALQVQGVSSAFTFGQYFGETKAILVAAKLPLRLVVASEWQRLMHRGASSKLEPKNRSLEAARLLWPNETFFASPKCRVPHDGLYEAALIGEFTRRSLCVSHQAASGLKVEERPNEA